MFKQLLAEFEALRGHGVSPVWLRRDEHHHQGFPQPRDEPLCARGL